MLSHIYQIKKFKDINTKRDNGQPQDGIDKLYSDFLFFKHFYNLDCPLIFCEGKTDNIYLKCAIKKLAADFPKLVEPDDQKFSFKVKFFRQSQHALRVLDMATGTGGINYLMQIYKRRIKKYKCQGKKYPVICLVDNDEEVKKSLFSLIKNLTNSAANITGDKPFYHIIDNLYIVPIPQVKNQPTIIEDYFDQSVKDKEVGGKKLNLSNGSSKEANSYSKTWFAEKVIAPHYREINFDEFKKILTPIVAVIEDYSSKL